MKDKPSARRYLWVFLLAFFLKVSVIAVVVTSPWDVSDEIGHMGYVKHLATGQGVPVFMETRMDEEMWRSMVGDSVKVPDFNWIAQHPPLYYLYMIPSYWIGSMLGDTFEYPFYAARIWSSLLAVLALFLVFKTTRIFCEDDVVSLVVTAMVGSIPLVSQTAAGVNNDTLLLLLSIALGYRWVSFYKLPSRKNLVWLGLVLGLCGITKYTFLLAMVPITSLILWRCIREKPVSIGSVVSFLCLGWVPFLGWAIRNWVVIGTPTPTMLEHLSFSSSTDYSVLEFFGAYPFFTHLFRSFWGIFGWQGSGQDLVLTTMHLPIVYQFLYALLLCILAVAGLNWLIQQPTPDGGSSAKWFYILATLVTLIIFCSGLFPNDAFYVSAVVYLTIFSVLFAAMYGAVKFWFAPKILDHWRIRIQIESILVCGFFMVVLIYQLLDYSNESGMLRGTFGRYCYAIFGGLLMAWIIPGVTRLSRWIPLVISMAVVMVLAEYWLWMGEVIPFFESR
jgi:4-amino-4-deoxy-L-arabinose transferase-like glycosyltransferase